MYRQRSVLLALGRYDHRTHRGVARYAGEHNWHLNCDMTSDGRVPAGWRGDGIITILDERKDLEHFVLHSGVPVVDLSITREDIALPRVTGDHVMIGHVAADHFLERGFRHFAWYSDHRDRICDLRIQGFTATLAEHGFTCERWFWQKPRGRQKVNEWQAKSKWLTAMMSNASHPLAVFAYRDTQAAHVLDACLEAGLRVPDDIAILGVDNNELVCECLQVPLSSVQHDLERLGYEGAALLNRLMTGQKPPQSIRLIPPKGIALRRSTDVLAVHHPAVRAAIAFLQQRYQDTISVADIARAADTPRRTLEVAFKRHLGRSIHDELAAFRLRRVKDYLTRTDKSVTDIAAEAGYNTPQYLNHVFRRATGLTPRKYRLRYGVAR